MIIASFVMATIAVWIIGYMIAGPSTKLDRYISLSLLIGGVIQSYITGSKIANKQNL